MSPGGRATELGRKEGDAVTDYEVKTRAVTWRKYRVTASSRAEAREIILDPGLHPLWCVVDETKEQIMTVDEVPRDPQ